MENRKAEIWLGENQYGTGGLGRDFRACRFCAGTRRLEARAADAHANSGPDGSRAAGDLVLLAVGMTSREVRSELEFIIAENGQMKVVLGGHLIWVKVL